MRGSMHTVWLSALAAAAVGLGTGGAWAGPSVGEDSGEIVLTDATTFADIYTDKGLKKNVTRDDRLMGGNLLVKLITRSAWEIADSGREGSIKINVEPATLQAVVDAAETISLQRFQDIFTIVTRDELNAHEDYAVLTPKLDPADLSVFKDPGIMDSLYGIGPKEYILIAPGNVAPKSALNTAGRQLMAWMRFLGDVEASQINIDCTVQFVIATGTHDVTEDMFKIYTSTSMTVTPFLSMACSPIFQNSKLGTGFAVPKGALIGFADKSWIKNFTQPADFQWQMEVDTDALTAAFAKTFDTQMRLVAEYVKAARADDSSGRRPHFGRFGYNRCHGEAFALRAHPDCSARSRVAAGHRTRPDVALVQRSHRGRRTRRWRRIQHRWRHAHGTRAARPRP